MTSGHANPSSILFRPMTAEDMPFLYEVYSSTRTEELAVLDWSDEARQAFLKMQFNAQHTYYMAHYADSAYLIILRGDQQIGRLYRQLRGNNLHILDIALLPQYRNRGIGTKLLTDIIAEAETIGAKVSIYVEFNNPALHLYSRLGFQNVDEQGVYFYMERPVTSPTSVGASTSGT